MFKRGFFSEFIITLDSENYRTGTTTEVHGSQLVADDSMVNMTFLLDIHKVTLSTPLKTVAKKTFVSLHAQLPLMTEGIETQLAVCISL